VSNASSASTSPDTPPERLFHLTPADNLESILEHGLRSIWGNYFSSDINTAGQLMAFNIISKPADTKWVAIEIYVGELEVERSTDHSVSFFGTDDSWVIWEDVPPTSIMNVYEVDFDSGAKR
jgi:RNA:NAD 2'-phosphotransferase (TPT1/KptA family)